MAVSKDSTSALRERRLRHSPAPHLLRHILHSASRKPLHVPVRLTLHLGTRGLVPAPWLLRDMDPLPPPLPSVPIGRRVQYPPSEQKSTQCLRRVPLAPPHSARPQPVSDPRTLPSQWEKGKLCDIRG